MANRVCTTAQNVQSAKEAGGKGKHYGPAHVTVIAVSQNEKKVTLRTKGTNGGGVTFTCAWNKENVWATCPTTLDCDFDRLPAIGDQGILYLSRELVELVERELVEGKLNVSIKWPDDLPAGDQYEPMAVELVSVTVHARELKTLQLAKVDLLDATLAKPGQSIAVDGTHVELQLTPRGFAKFAMVFPTLEEMNRIRETLKGAGATALQKSAAWAQVAAWEELRESLLEGLQKASLGEFLTAASAQ